jgi:PPM family protein phosphatase
VVSELQVTAAVLSDVGCHRESNEDRAEVVQPSESRRGGVLAVVADGMGGHAAGEVASGLAVDVIRGAYQECTGDPANCLSEALQQANRAIYDTARRDERLGGMGTTCTAVVVEKGQAHLAHVGDSRLYLVRGGGIYRMTEDHSAVMDLVRRGLLTAAEARHHADKNVILRALGTHPSVRVATWDQPMPVRAGDTLLLSSDGLHDLVEDEEIGEVVLSQPLEQACRRLVDLARERGGPDNITVVLLHFETESSESSAPPTRAAEVPSS